MAIDRPLGRRGSVAGLLRERFGRWAVAAPLLVTGLALAAVLVRIWLARRIAAPWILVDEIVYSELAKSFAAGGHFLLRGQETTSTFGPVYPVLISPAWLAHSTETSYALAKAINAVLMTVAVVPLYLWARRLVAPVYAVLAVALTLVLPSFVFTGTLMTENAFFPAFVLSCFAMAAALERPTLLRQGLALGAIALVCAVRIQGLVLALAFPSAIVLMVVLDQRAGGGRLRPRSLAGALRPYAATLAAVGVGAVAYLSFKLAQGSSLSSGLGAYEAAGQAHYSLWPIVRWLCYHLGELALSVGVLPVSALIVLVGLAWKRGARTSPAERAFLAVAVSAVAWLVLEVATFSSRFTAGRIEERNMFHVAPLLLLALVVWLDRGLPRSPGLTAAAVLVPAALLLTVPLEGLLNTSILSDTFGLIPFLRLASLLHGGTADVRVVLGLGLLLAGVLFAALPRRLALLAVPAGVALFLVLSSYSVFGSVRDFSRGVFAATGAPDRDWVDDAIGRKANATFLYGSGADLAAEATLLWETEFWNRSVGSVYNLGVPEPGGLPAASTGIDRLTGRIGATVPGGYLVVDRGLSVAGERRAESGPFALYRVDPPLRLASASEGVYGDGWMGADAAYTRYAGGRGTVVVELSRIAWSGTDVPGKVRIELGRPVAGAGGTLRIAKVLAARTWVIHSGRRRVFSLRPPRPPFRVQVHVEPTFSPSEFGSPDTRQLGAQVSFGFSPGS